MFVRNKFINFYPRPPRGGRLDAYTAMKSSDKISIHALREEGDSFNGEVARGFVEFLSTPSARRATLSILAACTSP